MLMFLLPNRVWGGFVTHEHSPLLQKKVTEAFSKFPVERIAEDPGVEGTAGWGKAGSQKFIETALA